MRKHPPMTAELLRVDQKKSRKRDERGGRDRPVLFACGTAGKDCLAPTAQRLPGIVAVFLWSRVSREMRQALARERQCAGMDFYSGFTTVYRFRVVSFEKLIAQRAKLDVFIPSSAAVTATNGGCSCDHAANPEGTLSVSSSTCRARPLPRGWARDACFPCP